MTPSNSQKIHLRQTGSRTACGLGIGANAPPGRAVAGRFTDTPSKVTCQACRRSLFMADTEILHQRKRRRRT